MPVDRKEKKEEILGVQRLDLDMLTQTLLPSFFLYGSVCKVNTQDPENFDEELKSLVTAWLTLGKAASLSLCPF